jgi:transcriptional regulator with XRE-family HTH domain
VIFAVGANQSNLFLRYTLCFRRKPTLTIVAMNIGPVIRRLRLEKGLTLEQLALAANTDAGNLSRMEHNHQKPSMDKLLEVAAALEVPISAIFAEAEGEAITQTQKQPRIKSLTSRIQKLTPHHQAVVAELVNGLLKLQKRDEGAD